MTEEKEITLTSYIEGNHNLLSILGVFIALTIFSTSINLGFFTKAISFLSISCVILIWLELWSKFPKNGTLKLVLFEEAMSFIFLALTFYWIVEFKNLYQSVGLLLAILILYIISSIIKKYNLFNRLFKTNAGGKKSIRYILGIIILVTIWIISFEIANPIVPFIDNLIEQMIILSKEYGR